MAGVNTNIMSLTAQRNLGTNSASLATTMQRLSSGMRVNSAKDDAAGLAIAERMNSQVKGMNVAVRNANDGISMAQTAEGGLSKIGDSMQRMRELAVQSRNGTNSDEDKAALNKEFQTLRQEIGRVIESTKFNGKSILSADAKLEFQVGSNTTGSDRISIAGLDMKADASMAAITQGFKQTDTIASVATTATTNVLKGLKTVSTASAASVAGTDTNASNGTPSVASAAGGDAAVGTTWAQLDASSQSALRSALGIAATATVDATSTVQGLVGAKLSGGNLTAAQTQGNTSTAAISTLSADVQEFAASNGTSNIKGAGTDIDAIIQNLDTALNTVNGTRASFGAAQTRMEAVVGNLQVASENQSAARSRIMDTDYATETANLSRSQVLQQASQAMLAQANQAPQSVLQLLR